jgi:hypothetical protein
MNKLQKYLVRIEVRDESGKIILDQDNNKVMGISYEVEMLESNVEANITRLAKEMKALMPNRKINIDFNHFNTISRTYMTMYSYYVDENRFVKL